MLCWNVWLLFYEFCILLNFLSVMWAHTELSEAQLHLSCTCDRTLFSSWELYKVSQKQLEGFRYILASLWALWEVNCILFRSRSVSWSTWTVLYLVGAQGLGQRHISRSCEHFQIIFCHLFDLTLRCTFGQLVSLVWWWCWPCGSSWSLADGDF